MAHANPGAHLIGKSYLPPAPEGPEERLPRSHAPATGEQDASAKEIGAAPQPVQRRLDQAEAWLENLYNYHIWHPRFTRVIVVIAGLGLIMIMGGWGYLRFVRPPVVEPIYTKVERVKQLGKLRLVRHLYESVIPIAKNKRQRNDEIEKQKLQFLLMAPVEIFGYVDLSQVEIEILRRDSLVRMTLPHAQASVPYLNLAQTRDYLVQSKGRWFGKRIEVINHQEAYRDIATGLNESKAKVVARATANGLLTETEEKATIFLRSFVRNLGYKRVEIRFAPTPSNIATTPSDSSSFVNRAAERAREFLEEIDD